MAEPVRRRSLAAMIICCNEADRIEDCLRSLSGWVDEIVVLDSGSSDDTVAIARRYTDKIWVTDWPGYGAQRNRALQKVTSEWVLVVDADERATPELRAEVDARLSDPALDRTLLQIPWRTYLFGGALRFGRYATPQNRLFLRAGARFREHQVHEQVLLPQRRSAVLDGRLDHHSWRDYAHLRNKHRHYAGLLARQKFAEGQRGNLPYACLRLCTDFLQQYLLRLSILDGWRGLVIAITLGRYAYWKYADLRLLETQSQDAPTPALSALARR